MSNSFKLVNVTSENVDAEGFFCVKNKKHPGYKAKRDWLEAQLAAGLKIVLLKTADEVLAGFVEYVPFDHTYRAIDAPNHLVIHCLWVDAKKAGLKGASSVLLNHCVSDASANQFKGVAVVASDGPWMAGPGVFLKNGFEPVDTAPPYYHLLVRSVTDAGETQARFPDNWNERLTSPGNLRLYYTNQCPYIGKAVNELPPVATKYGVELELIEVKNPDEARAIMPSPYGVFALVNDGTLLADHAISATRFRNILTKDLGLTA